MKSFDDAFDAAPPARAASVFSRRDSTVPRISRRSAIARSAGLLGGALALALVDRLPGSKPKVAHAARGTEHWHCANYDHWSGYSDDRTLCVGAPYGAYYCGRDKWFKIGRSGERLWYPVVACGAVPYALRNAWRWTHRGRVWRCADGHLCTGGRCVFRICSAAL